MKQVGIDDDGSVYSGSNDQNVTAYKVTISIIFGLLGFAVNFYPVDFVFYGSYRMSFLLGLLFPMLITLAWGWKYGLLSALCGGCQTMWILWMPQSGYGPLVSVPPFTLWIVWLGWFSRTRHSLYLGEIIFRLFNTALLYTVFRWVFTLNVPPANVSMPLSVTHSIVFKEAVNGIFILFLAQALLYLNATREFFKLPKSTASPHLYYMYTNAVILGGILLFGFVGERYIWNMWGAEFQDMARILGSLLLLMVGIACTYSAANVFAKRKTEDLIRAEERITHLNAVLRAIRNVNQLITREKNRDRLLQSACDNLIETRGYYSVWIALLDEAGELVTATEAGLGGDFLPMVERLKRGELTACGRRALSQPGIVVTEDTLSVCADCPLSVDCGGRGAMTVRLEHEGKVYGLSSVSIPADFTADEEERALFEEVAGDIAFALHNIKLDEERKRAEEALKEYSERLEEMVEERTQELQDAQEQLIRREKLAILGQLAGGVGHELRNPLGVISNAVYFLQITLADADETTREYLDIVSSEVRDADKIVSDLLDFSRTRPAEKEKIAVSALVSQVLKRRPPPEDVEVVTEIPSDLPPVFVDPRQMGQVLTNLVTNAYQAMPDGGRLMIHVSEDKGIGRRGDTGTRRQGDSPPVSPSPCLRVSISDTGCGISEENVGKIFEPLFTTKAKGIGLGLPISKNLVEANGGSIEVESEEGKGSAFTVRLGTGD